MQKFITVYLVHLEVLSITDSQDTFGLCVNDICVFVCGEKIDLYYPNIHKGPLLLMWFNFNSSMDKKSHAQ